MHKKNAIINQPQSSNNSLHEDVSPYCVNGRDVNGKKSLSVLAESMQ